MLTLEDLQAKAKQDRLGADLHDAVAAVCPIDGVCVGAHDDRRTWYAHFTPEATDAQRDAAKQVIETFVQP